MAEGAGTALVVSKLKLSRATCQPGFEFELLVTRYGYNDVPAKSYRVLNKSCQSPPLR